MPLIYCSIQATKHQTTLPGSSESFLCLRHSGEGRDDSIFFAGVRISLSSEPPVRVQLKQTSIILIRIELSVHDLRYV